MPVVLPIDHQDPFAMLLADSILDALAGIGMWGCIAIIAICVDALKSVPRA